jgi:hypothetical protein
LGAPRPSRRQAIPCSFALGDRANFTIAWHSAANLRNFSDGFIGLSFH